MVEDSDTGPCETGGRHVGFSLRQMNRAVSSTDLATRLYDYFQPGGLSVTMSLSRLCFIVLALLCFYHCISRIDVLIYSAAQLQDCLIILLTYLLT